MRKLDLLIFQTRIQFFWRPRGGARSEKVGWTTTSSPGPFVTALGTRLGGQVSGANDKWGSGANIFRIMPSRTSDNTLLQDRIFDH